MWRNASLLRSSWFLLQDVFPGKVSVLQELIRFLSSGCPFASVNTAQHPTDLNEPVGVFWAQFSLLSVQARLVEV